MSSSPSDDSLSLLQTAVLSESNDRNSVAVEDLHNAIVGGVRKVNRSYIELAYVLAEFKKRDGYEQFNCSSFREYFRSYINGMGYSKAVNLVKIHNRYREHIEKDTSFMRDLFEIGYEKANRIAKFADSPHLDEWIEKAKTLTQKELRAEIREADNDEPPRITDTADESGQTVVGGEVVPGWVGDVKKRIDNGVDDPSAFADWLIELAKQHR